MSWWAGIISTEGAGLAVDANRCCGGSGVRVEIQASSSTISNSREPNSRVTSSPTPSIRAITTGAPTDVTRVTQVDTTQKSSESASLTPSVVVIYQEMSLGSNQKTAICVWLKCTNMFPIYSGICGNSTHFTFAYTTFSSTGM